MAPIYEYQCAACGDRSEVLQGFNDPSLEICVYCKVRKLVRLISVPAGIVFKGEWPGKTIKRDRDVAR